MLSDLTRDALTDYYHNVYERPGYFPDNTDLIKQGYPWDFVKETEKQSDSKKEDICTLALETWEMCMLEGVINNIGPARRHCCFKDILIKVYEYEGGEVLKTVLEKLFEGVKNPDPACKAKFERYFGDNADHIMLEIMQLYEHLGQNIKGILDIVAFDWKLGEATRNMTDFAAFQCLLDDVNRCCRGKEDAAPKPEAPPPLNIAEEAKKGHDAYVNALYQSLQKPVPTGHTPGVPGVAPVWPPGSYITNKPWMTLQCTESYPTRAGDEFKRKKTMVDSLYLKRSKIPKRVTFADGTCINDEDGTCNTTEPIVIPRHGFPRYKGYLDDILPVHIDWDLEKPLPDSQKPPSLIPPFAQPPLPSPPTSPHRTTPPRSASPGPLLLSPPLPAASTTPSPAPLPTPLPASPRRPEALPDAVEILGELSDVTSAGGKKRLPPLPLAATLEPTGDRIQDRLGLCFKSKAHKR